MDTSYLLLGYNNNNNGLVIRNRGYILFLRKESLSSYCYPLAKNSALCQRRPLDISSEKTSLYRSDDFSVEMAREIKIWLVMPLLFLATSQMQHCVHGESKVPCLFIFGDSISDSGNNNELPTNAKSNFKPYGIDFPMGATGRFTNGRTAIDLITQFLGFEKFIPPFANTNGSDILKGVNYASGAAGIRTETAMNRGFVISLGLQLANHQIIVSQIASRLGSLDKAKSYLNKCLYYVNIGSNDYINNYFLPQIYPTSHIYSPEEYADVLLEELSLNLMALHKMGARKYVVVGLGLLGCTVHTIRSHGTDGSCVEEENYQAFIYDDKLKSLVDHLNNKLSIDSKFIFINTTTQSLVVDESYGFTVSTAACCPTGSHGECIADQMPCDNRNEYVFWDEFHPTEEWNQHVAITSYNSTNPFITYPMHIQQLVDHDMETLDIINETTPQLSASI